MEQEIITRIYAGWLGKIIGIRLGAPIEGWTYEKIKDIYGELTGYLVDYQEFAAFPGGVHLVYYRLFRAVRQGKLPVIHSGTRTGKTPSGCRCAYRSMMG